MAAPTNKSLKYFNIDTRQQDNLDYVESIHGPLGYALVVKLWKHIYASENGCWVLFNEMQQRIFLRNNPGFTIDLLGEVLATCFMKDVEIFDGNMLQQHGVLTSHGIQARWLKIVVEAKRKEIGIDAAYLLLTPDEIEATCNIPSRSGKHKSIITESFPVNSPIIPELSENNGGIIPELTTVPPELIPESFRNNEGIIPELTTQKKEKESKVNERKEKEIKRSVGNGAGAPAQSDKKISSNDGERGKIKRVSKGEIPGAIEQAELYFTEKMKHRWDSGFISLQANKFWAFYEGNGWVQGKKSKPIVKWKACASLWIYNVLEGTFANFQQYKPPVKGAPTTAPVYKQPITKNEIEVTVFDFVNDLFRDFVSGELPQEDVPASIYGFLCKSGILGLSTQDKERIKIEANGDDKEAKRIAVVEKFLQLKTAGQKAIFELVK